MTLPTGTVTFLSPTSRAARRWRSSTRPSCRRCWLATMPSCTSRMRDTTANVFKSSGDASGAAFSTAADVLPACGLDAQRACILEAWTRPPSWCGWAAHRAAAEDAGDYTGYVTLTPRPTGDVGRYGGQVLLSATIAELLRGHLPDGVILRELGEQPTQELAPTSNISGRWLPRTCGRSSRRCRR